MTYLLYDIVFLRIYMDIIGKSTLKGGLRYEKIYHRTIFMLHLLMWLWG